MFVLTVFLTLLNSVISTSSSGFFPYFRIFTGEDIDDFADIKSVS